MPKPEQKKGFHIGANPHRIEVEKKRKEVEQTPVKEVTLQDIYAQNLYIIDLLTKRS